MIRDPRWWIVGAVNVAFLVLVARINHGLSAFQISVFAAGLPIAFAALRLSRLGGFAVTGITALFYGAGTSLNAGWWLIFFLAAHIVILQIRRRVPGNEDPVGVLAAAGVNAAIMVVWTALHWTDYPYGSPALLRIGVDFAASTVFIGVTGVWFFALQTQALRFFGVHLESEAREPG